MTKLKRSLKKIELDTNVAKNGQFRIFTWQEANSAADGEFRDILLALIISTECLETVGQCDNENVSITRSITVFLDPEGGSQKATLVVVVVVVVVVSSLKIPKGLFPLRLRCAAHCER